MKRKKGIVAMLDILGYSSLIENNDIGENTYKILELIESSPAKLIDKGANEIDISESEFIEKYKSISTLVFSDTLLITLEIEESLPPDKKIPYFAMFLFYLSGLFKDFLDNGLPLRGCVSYGEYITHQHCFAGKPIINAYNSGKNLDSAGVVLDEYFLAQLVLYSQTTTLKPLKILALDRLVGSFKDKKKSEAFFVSIFPAYHPEEFNKLENPKELAIYLTKSFTAHNKGLSAAAKEKLDNTIELFEEVFEKNKLLSS